MNKKITIYKRGTESEVRCYAPICQGSAFKFLLKQTDEVTIKFTTNEQISFKYGDYINTSQLDGFRATNMLAPKYVICEANNPTYNETTDSYTYNIKFKAWYYALNKYVFMLPYKKTTGIYRRETSWSVTDTIEAHMRLWLINADLLGHELTCKVMPSNAEIISIYKDQGDFITSKTIKPMLKRVTKFHNDPKFINYDRVNLIDALNQICEAYECDWWFDDHCLVVSRAENTNTPIEVTNYTNATIKASGSEGSMITRLYAYGSSTNIVSSYRKILKMKVSSNRESQDDITDILRPLNPTMFRNTTPGTASTKTASYTGRRQLNVLFDGQTPNVWDNSTVTNIDSPFGGGGETVTFSNPSASRTFDAFVSCNDVMMGMSGDGIDSTNGIMQKVKSSLLVVALGIPSSCTFERCDIDVKVVTLSRNGQQKTIATKTVTTTNASDVKRYGNYTIFEAFANFDINAKLEKDDNNIPTLGVLFGNVRACFETDSGFIQRTTYFDVYSSSDVKVISPYNSATFTIKMADGNHSAIINETGLPYYDTNSAKIKVLPLVAGGNAPEIDDGTEYEILNVRSTMFTGKIPLSYFSESEESEKQNSVAETRLMLPKGTPYVELVDDSNNPIVTDDNDIIEGVEFFDDVYPKRKETITAIKTKEYERSDVYDVSGEVVKKRFNAYQFKAQYASSDFSEDYIIKDGEGLFVTFNTGNLAGMTFEVNWNPTHEGEAYNMEVLPDGKRNPDACWFEIIVNENYGRMLPDDVLYPSIGDEFVIYGYDSSYYSDNMIEDAEQELLKRAKQYLEKQLHNDRTYTITLIPSYAKKNMFDLGDLVKLTTPNYIMPNRTERVIGCEICLDIPEDNPKYICGEKAIYSRLRSIEDKIKNN